jgi:hypothetical protein
MCYAGYCIAVMHVLQFYYSSSIFAGKKNQEYWDPQISWKNKYKGKKGFVRWFNVNVAVIWSDAWHSHLFRVFVSVFVAMWLFEPIPVSLPIWAEKAVELTIMFIAAWLVRYIFMKEILIKRN